jgi:hypothetical protein
MFNPVVSPATPASGRDEAWRAAEAGRLSIATPAAGQNKVSRDAEQQEKATQQDSEREL